MGVPSDSVSSDAASCDLSRVFREIHPQHVSVVIADAFELTAEGLASLVSKWPELEVKGTASNRHDLLLLAKRYRPDVVVLDAEMEGPSCPDVIRALRATSPRTKVIVLAPEESSNAVLESVRAGAHGYYGKRKASGNILRVVIWGVACGDVVFDGDLSPVFDGIFDARPKTVSVEMSQLSVREIDILPLVVRGLSNKDIAEKLYLCEATVKKVVSDIARKFGAENRVQVAVLASQSGIGF